MIIVVAAAAAGAALSLTALIGLHRRHRARPPIYQLNMAKHLWQPRKFR